MKLRVISDFVGEDVKVLKYAVIIAVIAGIITVTFIYLQAKSESYSALYLVSYSNYIENGTVSFVYGIDRFGPERASYDLNLFVDGVRKRSQNFEMSPGSGNGTITFPLKNVTEFPVKVEVVLTEAGGETYDVHFWLNGNRG